MGKKTVVIVFNVMLEMSDFFIGTVLDSGCYLGALSYSMGVHFASADQRKHLKCYTSAEQF
jgi:hypothetical protein